MKRLHVHIAVENLDASVRFYSQLFAAKPVVLKSDYAKCTLEDPRVNFGISWRGAKPGIQHLGIQVYFNAALGYPGSLVRRTARPNLRLWSAPAISSSLLLRSQSISSASSPVQRWQRLSAFCADDRCLSSS